MPWSGDHLGFVVENICKNDESAIWKRRTFLRRFGLCVNESVSDLKISLLWIQRIKETRSALKRKTPGRSKNVRTPENIAGVRVSIETYSERSARKHAFALRISERIVGRILPTDLQLHPYKNMIVHELNPEDWKKRID